MLDSLWLGKTETIEFCHSFDLGEYEKNEGILSNLYTLSVKKEDFVESTLRAVSQFTLCCKEEGIVGRIILDVGDFLCDDVIIVLWFECRQNSNESFFHDCISLFEEKHAYWPVFSTEN